MGKYSVVHPSDKTPSTMGRNGVQIQDATHVGFGNTQSERSQTQETTNSVDRVCSQ